MDSPENNSGLIDRVLAKYGNTPLMEDVKQEAYALIIENQHKYDETRGKYSTFVTQLVYNALKKIMNEFSTVVRVPVSKYDHNKKKVVIQRASDFSSISTSELYLDVDQQTALIDPSLYAIKEKFSYEFNEEDLDEVDLIKLIHNELKNALIVGYKKEATGLSRQQEFPKDKVCFTKKTMKTKALKMFELMLEEGYLPGTAARKAGIDRCSVYKTYLPKIKQAGALAKSKLEDQLCTAS